MSVKKPSTLSALRSALHDRQVLAILFLGISSGLPYGAIGGTLNAWLSTVDVKPSTIGLLSWALLAYSFKFMWAAAFQSRREPLNLKIGPYRAWMTLFLVAITCGLFVLASMRPPNGLAIIGLVSVLIAVLSASFDTVLAAWRIQIARDDMHLDVLSVVEQFGYRAASLLSGFVALIAADHFGWPVIFICGGLIYLFSGVGIWLAAPTKTPEDQTNAASEQLLPYLDISIKRRMTAIILLCWGIAFYIIAEFMYGALTQPENYNARNFIRNKGSLIIVLTVISLGIGSAILKVLNDRNALRNIKPQDIQVSSLLDILYQAIVIPMVELITRLKWAVILVVALVLSYRFTDLIWGGFAYPFYLGENYGALGHTLTEVGFASKLMGVFATIFGIMVGGIAMIRFGRMPVFVFGAIFAALTNLVFADLALDAHYTDAVLGVLQIDDLFAAFGLDQRMARLTTAIFVENTVIGIASAASVAYLSSIVNKKYAVVQYALLVSLVMLLGVLGRPTIGAIIETDGFATAFIVCAALGAVAVVLSLIEWARLYRHNKAQSHK